MLRPRRRTRLVATAAVFASIYAILGLIPISALVGTGGFITFREAISPLAGMVLGPLAGGLSIVLGVFLDFGLGRPVVFLGLDFMVDLLAAVLAGLCFTGRRKLALGLPILVLAVFVSSPFSLPSVGVGGVEVPFVWMHLLSVVALGAALLLEARKVIGRLSWAFVTSVMLASTMAAHAMGGILTENVYLARGVLFGYQTVSSYWTYIFYLYPEERIFLTVVGALVSVPVLRALSRTRRDEAIASG
ncbi:MAG: hypothetical protein ACHQYR_03945 [Candidatus Gagatemarchaeaceae archaeon]